MNHTVTVVPAAVAGTDAPVVKCTQPRCDFVVTGFGVEVWDAVLDHVDTTSPGDRAVALLRAVLV